VLIKIIKLSLSTQQLIVAMMGCFEINLKSSHILCEQKPLCGFSPTVIIITDPKQELYEKTSQYLRDNGYNVKVFNLVRPENSDSWNCVGEIQGSELMAQLFCDVVIKNTGSAKGDYFWDNSELNLLKALVLYVDSDINPENRNI
jgi:type IV secretion system protein VirD4